jgi:hypothetical protein
MAGTTAALRGARSALLARVCDAMEAMAPVRLAGAWDNVGVLIDAPDLPADANVVFLTNDLTEKVRGGGGSWRVGHRWRRVEREKVAVRWQTLDEAIEHKAAVIVTYHPTPFAKVRRFERDGAWREEKWQLSFALARRHVARPSGH